ncbi:MAG TPA: MarR family transcriptional regulator [Galbitalea sp.]|jgi:DNA-binding MarR family transcriptional regulator
MNAAHSPRTARRSPTAAELSAWRTFIETSERMRSAIGSRLQADSSLSTGDYAVLLSLSEAPGQRVRSSELACAVGWERSRLSHHLGRMEQRGLIRREECATDSRGAEACLTATGAQAFRAASAPHLHAINELFVNALTGEQLAQIAAIGEALAAHLDEAVA